MRKVLILFVALFLAGSAGAQTRPVPDGWHPLEEYPGSVGLWQGGRYLGRLDPFEGVWQSYGRPAVNIREWTVKVNPPKETGAVGDLPKKADPKPAAKPAGKPIGRVEEHAKDCPCPVCERDRKESHLGPEISTDDTGQQIPTGGVTLDKAAGERYSLGGREATQAEAMHAIESTGAAKVPDDAALTRVFVIGSERARRPVVEDLKTSPAFAGMREVCLIQDSAPDHWWAKDRGYKGPATEDGVVIYGQAPDGTVLWHQEDYAGGAPALTRALRDKVPGYDPSKDPGPAGTPVSPAWGLTALTGVALVVFLAVRKRA